MGFDAQILQSVVNKDGNGRFILRCIYFDIPLDRPGASYEEASPFELFWDQDAKWFGIRAL